jgi:hypothetical protein
MRIRRRSLRKFLAVLGCVVATVGYPAAMVGGLLLLAGSGLHFWSKGCLQQNRRLTTAGPYRWTRNPFYLANFLIDLGLCFVIGRWWVALAFLPVWWFSYRETIAREEARLLTLFPDEFPEYLNAVPRLFPNGRHLPSSRAEGHFDWNNDALSRGSEYARVLSVWLAAGTIWACAWLRHERMDVFDERNSWGLGLIAALLCAWIVKLALAETFRRPETVLLPFASRPILRHAVLVVLVAGVAFFQSVWAVSVPVTWCLLILLDRIGESQLGPHDLSERPGWRYFPVVAVGSIATLALVSVLLRSVGG